MERRLAERFETELHLTCRAPARPCRAILLDLSYEGCRIEVPHSTVDLGGTALIDLPKAPGFAGRIVWVNGHKAGIRFHRRLPKASAIALGIEQAEPEADPEPPRPEGILRHWVRKLMGF